MLISKLPGSDERETRKRKKKKEKKAFKRKKKKEKEKNYSTYTNISRNLISAHSKPFPRYRVLLLYLLISAEDRAAKGPPPRPSGKVKYRRHPRFLVG
jgi:hypothetical protein